MPLSFAVRSFCWGLLLALAGGICPLVAAEEYKADPLDWPNWRGPEQNGISRETGLPEEWEVDGPTMLWKSTELAGRSSPIIMDGKLYTIVAAEPYTPRQGEKVICADAATGKVLWEHRFNVFNSDVPLERVGWGCCVGDPTTHRVYAMGVCGYFVCLEGESGDVVWSRSLSEEFGLLNTYGGRTNVPVVFEDMVIISGVMINWGNTDAKWNYQAFNANTGGWGDMAKPAHRFMAMNKKTGEVVWLNGTRLLPDDTTYSTPTIAVLGGQAALVFGAGDGSVYAMQPRTGNLIWRYEISQRGLNVSPLVVGDTVYTGQSEENPNDSSMGALAAINGAGSGDITKSGAIWHEKEVMVGKSSPILVDDKLYCVDDSGGLWVFDPATGEQIGGRKGRTARANFKLGSMMRASLVWADGKIYAAEANGRCYIFQPDEDGLGKPISVMRLPDAGEEKEEVHGSPAISHGRVYLSTTGHLYCFANKDSKPSATERPALPQEDKLTDKKPSHVQVVPADVVLKPGEKQKFSVEMFNARGQSLGQAEAKFSVDAAGEIDKQGVFTAESEPKHQAALVTAQVGDLKGHARLRVIPPLPWKFDFSDGQVPITWVGCRYRHVAVDGDLLDKLTKTDPLAGQLYIYLMSSFTNSGRPSARYEDLGPVGNYTAFLRYLGLLDTITTVDEAKKALEPSLQRLVDEKVLAKFVITTADKAPAAAKPGAPVAVAPPKKSEAPGEAGGDTTAKPAVPAPRQSLRPASESVVVLAERGPRKIDGNGLMLKITTIPKGTRSQGWMGWTDFHDYTFQADVRGTKKNGKMPDIGLINQRYTLALMANSQQLQLRSWVAEVARRETV
ncbi:MAG: PQQ-binding-like beta-propeller repeat protein, partial [Pirellulales bacterium]